MTKQDRLALRRESDNTFAFIGTVTGVSKSEVTVEMPDGRTSTIARKGVVFVNRGSLHHFARLGLTEPLQRAFSDQPSAVFHQALIDAADSLSAKQLKAKLREAGLPSDDIDRSWKSVAKALDEQPEVRVLGTGSAKKFKWVGPRESVLVSYVPAPFRGNDSADTGAHQLPSSQLRDDQPTGTATENAPSPDHLGIGAPTPRAEGGASDASVDRVTEAPDGDPADGGTLLTLLVKALGDEAPTSIQQFEREVLATATKLAHAEVSDVKALAAVPEVERLLVQLLAAAAPRPLKLVLEPRPIPTELAHRALISAIAESTRDRAQLQGLARFARRIYDMTVLEDLPLELVANAFTRAAASERRAAPSKDFLALADALARRTASSSVDEWATTGVAMPAVARAMSLLPLEESGPRARYLASLYARRPELLMSDALWADADLVSLHAAAGGELRRAFQDPELEEVVIRPAVETSLAGCTTRHDLGTLIALRGSFARFISAGALTAAMERVAQNDARAAEWMVRLRRDDTVSELRDKAMAATRAAENAETRATGARTQLERLNTELATVREQLRKAIDHNADAGEAQLRQAKLDVLRSLANLASHVFGSPAAQEDPSLGQRVEFTLRREGLSIIGSPGESVPYDPALHDAQGEHVNPGSPVSVGRSGYTYDAGNETVVLAKALVSAM